ncbi:MAG: T9SS type A sorting domain-containing protein [Saprospiraceae bacterium]|nr:T9SS type A sorting domain-containing protein [Saprospiraceae bacterium]
MENPTTNHNDNQPFFSIKCDLASSGNLCFDGSNFPADRIDRGLLACNPYDSLCYEENDFVKYTRWTCHRFHIPKSEIGNIATLSITAADCGRDPLGGGHFGYVYIDGICESCGGGSYGSASISEASYDLIVSCQGDSISIKGNYTLPTINGGYTIFDDFTVPGFNIYGKSINTTNKTFSFRIVKSDFQSPNPSCRDVIAYLKFKNANNDFLPDVPTNAIEICLDDFVIPEVDIIVGGCHRNNPNDFNYSDDYYYVDFTIQDADNLHWTLERQLDDPPSGESGRSFLNQNGYGNGLHILGPFYIQEGPWTLILNYNHCADTFYITPPDYCSGCPVFAKTKITNINCVAGNTWTFDLLVAGNPPTGSKFRIIGENFDRDFGFQYTNLPGGAITQSCITLRLQYYINGMPDCIVRFTICPPKPCTNNPNCNFEAYIERINCLNNGNYSVNFITKGGGFPCFRALGNTTDVSGPFVNPLGPFNEDVTITLLACDVPFSCACGTGTNCYKIYYVDRPDDCPRDLEGRLRYSNSESQDNELIIVPNPVIADEFLLRSNLKVTDFEIYNSTGILIKASRFEGAELRMKFNNAQGVYYIKYKDSVGQIKSVKFIKL